MKYAIGKIKTTKELSFLIWNINDDICEMMNLVDVEKEINNIRGVEKIGDRLCVDEDAIYDYVYQIKDNVKKISMFKRLYTIVKLHNL